MANLYVASTGSNTSPYDTWAKAARDPATAVNAAAAGDTVYIHSESFTLVADTTWTLAGTVSSPVTVICSNDTTNAPPQTLGAAKYTQDGALGRDFSITGIGFIYGFTYESTGTGSVSQVLNLGTTDGTYLRLKDCGMSISPTQTSTATALVFGNSGETNDKVVLENFTLQLGNYAGQGIKIRCPVEWIGGTAGATAELTSLFLAPERDGYLRCMGIDFTGLGASTVVLPSNSNTVGRYIDFINCKFSSSSTIVGSFTGVSQSVIRLFDCSTGDQHYQIAHYDYLGSTIVETSIYANDGASYDGTNHYSWKIVTTANASYAIPYASPWIEKYHSATSSITPYLEILRDGSATAYNDNQVWAEFGCKTTASSTLMTFSNDGMALLGSAAAQTTGVGASGWTGENATAWFGKCVATASITPAEIGMLIARVVVGEPSITVYADPTIRT